MRVFDQSKYSVKSIAVKVSFEFVSGLAPTLDQLALRLEVILELLDLLVGTQRLISLPCRSIASIVPLLRKRGGKRWVKLSRFCAGLFFRFV